MPGQIGTRSTAQRRCSKERTANEAIRTLAKRSSESKFWQRVVSRRHRSARVTPVLRVYPAMVHPACAFLADFFCSPGETPDECEKHKIAPSVLAIAGILGAVPIQR